MELTLICQSGDVKKHFRWTSTAFIRGFASRSYPDPEQASILSKAKKQRKGRQPEADWGKRGPIASAWVAQAGKPRQRGDRWCSVQDAGSSLHECVKSWCSQAKSWLAHWLSVDYTLYQWAKTMSRCVWTSRRGFSSYIDGAHEITHCATGTVVMMATRHWVVQLSL